VRNRLSVKDKDPNYHYRIVNDTDDRIDQFKGQGYEVVENGGKVGDKRVDTSAGLGSSPAFSVGQGTKAVLMRIRKDWYDEDQQAKLGQVNATEETMRRDAKKAADYGSFETS
jgi:hypothetical protein